MVNASKLNVESHYKLMLEQELGIKINFNFDY